jgi:hypothetical protein
VTDRGRWAKPVYLLVCRHAGLVLAKESPVARPDTALPARDGSSALTRRQTKERGSPVCSSWDQYHLSGELRPPNRGVRERPCHAGCHAAPGDENRSAANTGGTMPKKEGIGPQCVCRQRGWASSSLRLQSSQASLNSNCQKNRRKQFTSQNDAAHFMQHRRQRFPTVRTVG